MPVTELTPHQQQALSLATSGRVGLLTGTPGTGKTFTAAQYLKSCGVGFAVCAPTGKAAIRITEAMQENGIDLLARTIHSTLEPKIDSDVWSFQRNRWNPLNFPTIVCDEASMIGTELMADFLNAVSEGTRILFVGDENQLPPVGHGCPFSDMIASGVIPHGHLTELHRYSGRIAKVCKSIKNDERWKPSGEIDLENESPENFKHIELGKPRDQIQAMHAVIDRMVERGLHPLYDMQVICAVNDNSPISRKCLNYRLQQKINPDGEQVEGGVFRHGDKVICLKNGVREPINGDDSEMVYIANGELGRIVSITNGRVVVRFSEDRFVEFGKFHWKEIDLGYAVTTHKFQGSQAPVVISMIDDYSGANYVCSRAWHYTALSRASYLMVTIGRMSTLLRHCQKVDIESRKTFLTERLQGCQTNTLAYT